MLMPDMFPLKILIVTDDSVLNRFIRLALGSDCRVVVSGEARDAFSARACIEAEKPDLIVLDSNLPGMSGMAFLSQLMRGAAIPVMMVVSSDRAPCIEEALRLGAADYLVKPDAPISARHFTGLPERMVEVMRGVAIFHPKSARAAGLRSAATGPDHAYVVPHSL